MPYQKLDELPEAVKGIPEHAQEIWMAAFNSAWDQYNGDESRCAATAWTAVKTKYEKKGDQWMPINMSDFPEWIEIFKAGTWTPSNGQTDTWTNNDLAEIASLYNPAIYEAPIVIGHPEADSPAYGWIEALKIEGDKLLAKPKQLLDEFKNLVKQGAYKKISVSLFPDMSLRHVGFLGGAAPAVKGLRSVSFARKKAGWQFEMDLGTVPELRPLKGVDSGLSLFQEDQGKNKQSQESRSKKYNIAIKDGGNVTKPEEWSNVPDEEFLDPVNYRYPCPDADQTRAAAAYWGKPDNQAQYSSEEKAIISKRLETREKHFKIGQSAPKGGNMKEFIEKLKAWIQGVEKGIPDDPRRSTVDGHLFTEVDLAAAEKRGKDLAFAESLKQVEAEVKAKEEAQKKLKEIETQKRKDGIASFCEAQIKEGKFTPALQKIIEPLMIFAATHEEPIEFAEGEKKPPIEILKLFLKAVPKLIEFSEIAGDGKTKIIPKDFDTAVEVVMKEQKFSKAKAITFCAKEFPELHEEYVTNLKKSSE